MTLESANICSQLLTLGAGEATRLSPSGKPQNSAPAVRREVAALVAEAKNGCDCSDQHRNVFVSVQKYFSLGTSIWTWTSALDPKLGEQGNGLYERREV